MIKAQHTFLLRQSIDRARVHLESLAQSRHRATKRQASELLCYLRPFEARFASSKPNSGHLTEAIVHFGPHTHGYPRADIKVSSGLIDIALRIDAGTNARLVCVD